MSKLSICHASLLESYLSVKLAICQSYLYVKAIYLSCKPIGKLSICQASYMSKLSICHASLLESYLSVKLAICQSYLFVMLATCHSYMSKQLAHLVPVLRKFFVKLPLINCYHEYFSACFFVMSIIVAMTDTIITTSCMIIILLLSVLSVAVY